MNYKIGVDIVEIKRIQLDADFICRILTDQEQQQYSQLKTLKRQKEYLAGRFAGKEAIYKALNDPQYLSYGILNDEDSRPYVIGHPEIQISLSHDGGMAIVFVLAEEKPGKE